MAERQPIAFARAITKSLRLKNNFHPLFSHFAPPYLHLSPLQTSTYRGNRTFVQPPGRKAAANLNTFVVLRLSGVDGCLFLPFWYNLRRVRSGPIRHRRDEALSSSSSGTLPRPTTHRTFLAIRSPRFRVHRPSPEFCRTRLETGRVPSCGIPFRCDGFCRRRSSSAYGCTPYLANGVR